jgi:hypothetical protein
MSQSSEILKHLLDGKSITSWEAIQMFGATRLGAIIFALKARGYNVLSELTLVKNRTGKNVNISVYWMDIDMVNEHNKLQEELS